MIVNPTDLFSPSLLSCSWYIILPQSFRPLWSPLLNSSLCLMVDEAQTQEHSLHLGKVRSPRSGSFQTEHEDSVLRGKNRSRLFLSGGRLSPARSCCCWHMMALMTWRKGLRKLCTIWICELPVFFPSALNWWAKRSGWGWGFISKYVSQLYICVCVWLIWWSWTLDTI